MSGHRDVLDDALHVRDDLLEHRMSWMRERERVQFK